MLDRMQRGLERLYRVETRLDVRDFLIDERARDAAGVQPRREQLIVRQEGDLEIGLFIERRALANLEGRPAARLLDEGLLGDFCLALEGVSHFVYLALRAAQLRPVSALELELQAEVDKFASCLLIAVAAGAGADPAGIRERLFGRFRLEAGLTAEERDRYLTATAHADGYARRIEERLASRGAIGDLVADLRRFYRLGYREKVEHIRR